MKRKKFMTVRSVLILGGYGNFGKRIAKSLSVVKGITILIAGRNVKKAEQLNRPGYSGDSIS